MSDWHEVTRSEPCPACGKPDWCAWSPDGETLKCERSAETPPGFRHIKLNDGGALFRQGADELPRPSAADRQPRRRKPISEKPAPDWAAVERRSREALSPECLERLARKLCVSPKALEELGVGWDAQSKRWTIPERDGAGRIIGFQTRGEDGSKRAIYGSKRGLSIPSSLVERGGCIEIGILVALTEGQGPTLLVEGMSDVAACLTLGIAAVGRPSNTGGASHLAEFRFLAEREVLVVGDRDGPGRDGAQKTTERLVDAWRKPVHRTLAPKGHKDVRQWLAARAGEGLDLTNGDACRAAGRELLEELREEDYEIERPPLSVRLLPGSYGRLHALLVLGNGREPAQDDVIYEGRLRPGEDTDAAEWTEAAFAAASESLGWLEEASDGRRIAEALAAELKAHAAKELAGQGGGEQPSVSELIVRLVEKDYVLGVSTEGKPFAVARDGPNIALPLRGSAEALRARLARAYRTCYGGTPSGTALADALTVLAGEAQECEAQTVYHRVGRHGAAIVIDMCDPHGRAIVVEASGWRIEDRSPVLFQRTALSGELPTPEKGGDLAELWDLIPIAAEDRRLLLGWLVHGLVPNEPHAILMIGGEQGSAKTTTAEFLVGFLDPSGVPTRSVPRDDKQWAVTAAGSWVIALDNVSSIPSRLSDMLCRAVTGDGWVDRALYSDSEPTILRFQRVLLLTSIDAGALRGDLGDRVVLVDLERISPERRRPRSELDARYEEMRPRILGALYGLLARVLAVLPEVRVERLPRMADFGKVLAAVDRVLGGEREFGALACYAAQSRRVAEEVVEGDLVAAAILAFVRKRSEWRGAVGVLLPLISPDPKPRGWPATPRALTARIKRVAPALRELGVEVIAPGPNARPRDYLLRHSAVEEQEDFGPASWDAHSTVGTVGPSKTCVPDTDRADSGPTVGPTVEGSPGPTDGRSDGWTIQPSGIKAGLEYPRRPIPDGPTVPTVDSLCWSETKRKEREGPDAGSSVLAEN